MPALEEKVIRDVEQRLARYLNALGEDYGRPEYVTSGGSAAIFKVASAHGVRAFKAFNPSFFSEIGAAAERKRLNVQRSTIGHSCPTLVQTFRVEEAEGTAIVEMEYLDWPSLDKRLEHVPDSAITPLISQLVEAVKYLESMNIVHRDIKPENIHVSHDFSRLKLLDLGVARVMEAGELTDSDGTDHGKARPFMATAQYSSPEYLFRLDEPSERLWRGLNFYQIGAVLHDLVMKKPIFDDEMQVKNRWLVAKAVLTKSPSFADTNPNRLISLKGLAARCLVKDLDNRLKMVDWGDFRFDDEFDPLTTLAGRLSKQATISGRDAKPSIAAHLKFDRERCIDSLVDMMRHELISVCGPSLPMALHKNENAGLASVLFDFAARQNYQIECLLEIEWLNQPYERVANVYIQARVGRDGKSPDFSCEARKLVQQVSVDSNDSTMARALAADVSRLVVKALDCISVGDVELPSIGRVIDFN